MSLAGSSSSTARTGSELRDGELPDFLPVVLEFAATGDPATGSRCCRSTGPASSCCGWRCSTPARRTPTCVEAVCATLPGPSPADRAAAQRLAQPGRRTETVGLRPVPRRAGSTRSAPMSTSCCGASCRTSTVAVLVAGHVWRYRYDQFGWTTRSSQLYETRLLRIGSPLFHFGILVVIVGHVIGLLIPETWTAAVGTSASTAYHVQAVAPRRDRRRSHPRRRRAAGLPPAHHRPGVHGHDPQRQDHVRRAGRGHRRRPGDHLLGAGVVGEDTTTARPSRRGSARSSSCSRTSTRWPSAAASRCTR